MDINDMDENCKLCFKKENDMFGVFSKKGMQLDVHSILLKHFHAQIINDDFKTNSVCLPCWTIVEQFDKLYKQVESLYESKTDIVQTNTIKHEAFLVEAKYESIDTNMNVDEHDEDFSKDEDDYSSTEDDNSIFTPVIKITKLKPQKDVDTDNDINDSDSSSDDEDNLPLQSFLNKRSASKLLNDMSYDDKNELIAKYFKMHCDICSSPFLTFDLARSHFLAKHNQAGYIICKCNQKHTAFSKIVNHSIWHDNPNAFQCKKCNKSFRTIYHLRTHEKQTACGSKLINFNRNECGDSFPKKYLRKKHEVSHKDALQNKKKKWSTNNKSDNVAEKETDYSSGEEYYPNSKATSSIKHIANPRTNLSCPGAEELNELVAKYFKMACEICSTPFATFNMARVHYKEEHSKIGYIVCKCTNTFDSFAKIVSHCQWHDNPDTFKCEQCNKSFRSKYQLRDHERKVHNDITYQCNECEDSFPKKYLLKKHNEDAHKDVLQQKKEKSSPNIKNDIVVEDDTDYLSDEEYSSNSKATKTIKHIANPRTNLSRPIPEELNELVAKYFKMACEICSTPFATFNLARIHYKEEHNKIGYLICQCTQTYDKFAKIVSHSQWHDNPEIFKCAHCKKSFRSKYHLRDHERLVHKDTQYKINAFGDSFSKKDFRRKHDQDTHNVVENDTDYSSDGENAPNSKVTKVPKIIKHIANPRTSLSRPIPEELNELVDKYFKMACEICSSPFATFNMARVHYKEEHNKIGYIVCQCTKTFDSFAKIISHCQWHDNPDIFKCKQCNKSFQSKYHLSDHARVVHKNSQYKCNECGESFTKQRLRTKHYQESHKEELHTMTEECPHCNQRFLLSYIKRHILNVHEHVNSRICDICAKYFQSAKAFELHYLVEHTNKVERVQCHVCGKWLKHLGMLKEHSKRHKDTKVACQICGKESINKQALRTHVRRIHEAKIYTCSFCNKEFKRDLALKEHMATHTGQMDLYSCNICFKNFRFNSTLSSHKKKEHPMTF